MIVKLWPEHGRKLESVIELYNLVLLIWKTFLDFLGSCKIFGAGLIQGHTNLLPALSSLVFLGSLPSADVEVNKGPKNLLQGASRAPALFSHLVRFTPCSVAGQPPPQRKHPRAKFIMPFLPKEHTVSLCAKWKTLNAFCYFGEKKKPM